MIYIICGVSGTGKSTVGKLLSDKIGLPFYDADDFHSEPNIKKMASGIPLEDYDRIEWLKTLSIKIRAWETSGGAVLACSALKELYRKLLVPFLEVKVCWVALEGSRELILERLLNRNEHFFKAELLDSQLEIYSRPENGWVFDVKLSPDEIVTEIIKNLNPESR